MNSAQTVLFWIGSWNAAIVYEPPVDHLCCCVLSEKSLSCRRFAREGQSGHMRPCPPSSPGNLLLMLADMVMWHLQQVLPRRSGHSVTVTPPVVKIPRARAMQPTSETPERQLLTFSFLNSFNLKHRR